GGEIDGMFSFLPYAGELSARTDVRLVEDLCPAPEDDWISTFTVSTPLVERHPEAVQAVVDVTLMAAEWAKSHAEDVVAIHAENLAVRPESIRLGYGADVHETLVPELSPSAVATLNQTQDYLLKHKLLDERIDIAAWSEPRFLESALAAAA
ncbi:MAG: 2'-hydroxybiphenyl-2-sulfinate desulfinase, partial [Pseudomonadota bacterium]|nr:2'-hydroxybiphenyl-2-sulfinate desulfinase [Pseudomonadota bacterium]